MLAWLKSFDKLIQHLLSGSASTLYANGDVKSSFRNLLLHLLNPLQLKTDVDRRERVGRLRFWTDSLLGLCIKIIY